MIFRNEKKKKFERCHSFKKGEIDFICQCSHITHTCIDNTCNIDFVKDPVGHKDKHLKDHNRKNDNKQNKKYKGQLKQRKNKSKGKGKKGESDSYSEQSTPGVSVKQKANISNEKNRRKKN